MAYVELAPPYRVEVTSDEAGTVCKVMVPDTAAPGADDLPVLDIGTPNGATDNVTPVTIQGTIDLANVGCDILLDSPPTVLGTFRAASNGKWTWNGVLKDVGLWIIKAHATNAAGTADSNPVQFQVSQSGAPPIEPPVTGSPPEPIVRVAAGATVDQIQAAINGASRGSVVLAAGSYNFAGRSVRLKANVTLWADGQCIVTGAPGPGSTGAFDGSGLANWCVSGKAPGQGFVFNGGLVNATSALSWIVENATFNNQPSNGYDGSAVRLSNSRRGQVWNCDFNGCQGNVIGMYNMSDIAIDGGHFVNCRQPISYQVPNNADRNFGRNCIVRRCTFEGCTRAAMEMGPSTAAPGEYFGGTIVEDNWFDNWNNPDASTNLPISLVGQASENTLVRRNFCRRGMGPNSVGRAAVAIEFAGSGECYDNTTVDFCWAGFTYKSGWNIHDPKGGTVHFVRPGQPNYTPGSQGWANNDHSGGTGTFAANTETTSEPPTPAKPVRGQRTAAQDEPYAAPAALEPTAISESPDSERERRKLRRVEREPFDGR